MLKNFTLIALAFLFISAFTSCQKDPESGANPGGTSYFTLGGAPGSCTSPVIAGSYNTGIELTQANTITLTVNVASTGTYNVHTNSNNGVYFLGGGTFTTTGPQTITLAGHGTANNTGNFTFVLATFNTCSFPLTFGSGSGGGPAAVYTYAGGTGNCTVANVNGMYASGIALNASNYVDVNVNVTTPGSYNITTNGAGNISFAGSGTFTTNGTQPVRLFGNGTPSSTGTFDYTPTNNGCKFSVTVAPPPPPATFTYNCPLTPTISGTFAAGTALTAASTIMLNVNVTLAGSYNISTTSSNSNGVTFFASGIFTSTGIKTITLTSNNTPMAAGTFSYTPQGASCAFDVTYTSGPPPPTDFLRCKINGTLTDFSDNMSGNLDQSSTPYGFDVQGFLVGGSDAFSIILSDDTNPIAQASSYKNFTTSNMSKYCAIQYTAGSTFYLSSLLNSNTFTVTITTLNATTIAGDFTGTIYENSTGPATKSITEGKFSYVY